MRYDFTDYVLIVAGAVTRVAVYALLALPAALVVVLSFTSGETMDFPPAGFSMQWYQKAFESEPFMSALWTSTYVAVIVAIAALVIGFAAAFAINRFDFPGKGLLQALAFSPLIVPAVVLGIGLLYLFAWMNLIQTMFPLFAGHLVLAIPYVVRTVLASLTLHNRVLEEAAMNLRASPLRVVRRITLPLILPGLLSAAIFAFVTSFGNVTVSVFLTYGGNVTLPVQLFTYLDHSYDPLVAAVSSIMIFVTLAVILIIERLIGAETLS
ncbi:ABC transporter permease [Mesorhizobium sp. M3A.F.Ca.ET.201.01.1.1]|uniref:ABC transporter permease n=1 Tax=Mesorhizobium sp. M3A.F.Ca.ET.201.01.1.1 TaxID=2563946 RepID=UPI000FE8449C|nr:ABC transporter permease [Mesorhizobium sp. M3A.F.Ca.ET.201.01.1.1]RWC00135.1 MAG: ABC transporter permease [Mesorhizobium sp.]TGS61888.1 ABC transporter permease [Mesorhizobium sp. M3A.F.Ca.ET.201.01.1.1]